MLLRCDPSNPDRGANAPSSLFDQLPIHLSRLRPSASICGPNSSSSPAFNRTVLTRRSAASVAQTALAARASRIARCQFGSRRRRQLMTQAFDLKSRITDD